MTEIYQQTGIQFAFLGADVNGEYSQCHPFVLCRDFLHDAVKAFINKNSWSIYGFNYEYGKHPDIDMSVMRMLVRKRIFGVGGVTTDLQKKQVEKVKRDMSEHALRLLHHYEELGDIPKSSLEEVTDPLGNPAFIFTGSPIWISNTFFISMYTYLIRLGDKDVKFRDDASLMKRYDMLMKEYAAPGIGTGKNLKPADNDVNYLRKNFDKLRLVMENRIELFGEEPIHPIFTDKTIPNGAFHDRCGIFNLCSYASAAKDINTALRGLVENDQKNTKESRRKTAAKTKTKRTGK